MARPILDNVLSSYSSAAKINSNNEKIEVGFADALSRNDSTANSMEVTLDMDSNSIINLPMPALESEAATKQYVDVSISTLLNPVISTNPSILNDIAELKAQTWAGVGTPDIAILKCNHTSNDGGGLFYRDSSDNTTTDDNGMVIVDASSNRWKRVWSGNSVDASWFGAVLDGSTDDTLAIQAALDYMSLVNLGGDVLLKASTKITDTLLVEDNGVGLIGLTIQADTSQPDSTIIYWDGPTGIPMIKFTTRAGVSKRWNQRIKYLTIDGQGVADIGLLLLSVNGFNLSNVYITGCTVDQIKFDCTDTVTAPADTQECYIENFYFAAAGSANGMHFAGTTGGNTSYNSFRNISGSHVNGAAFKFSNGDNNLFTQVRSFRGGGGTGYSVDIGGNGASSINDTNRFYHCAFSTGPIILRGVESGYTGGSNGCWFLFDTGNNSQTPDSGGSTIETDVDVNWEFDTGYHYKQAAIGAAFGENFFGASQARASATANTPLVVYSGSGVFMNLLTSGADYGVEYSGNNLRIRRIDSPGSGGIISTEPVQAPIVTATSSLVIGSSTITFGANDSGGAGFKVLRVPN